ncbi:hypothetical protein FQR65_LT20693 [Abscondita terminalis]|nr:hypothetical protein FQR65_LT20693 [Abscondita terminalis]
MRAEHAVRIYDITNKQPQTDPQGSAVTWSGVIPNAAASKNVSRVDASVINVTAVAPLNFKDSPSGRQGFFARSVRVLQLHHYYVTRFGPKHRIGGISANQRATIRVAVVDAGTADSPVWITEFRAPNGHQKLFAVCGAITGTQKTRSVHQSANRSYPTAVRTTAATMLASTALPWDARPSTRAIAAYLQKRWEARNAVCSNRITKTSCISAGRQCEPIAGAGLVPGFVPKTSIEDHAVRRLTCTVTQKQNVPFQNRWPVRSQQHQPRCGHHDFSGHSGRNKGQLPVGDPRIPVFGRYFPELRTHFRIILCSTEKGGLGLYCHESVSRTNGRTFYRIVCGGDYPQIRQESARPTTCKLILPSVHVTATRSPSMPHRPRKRRGLTSSPLRWPRQLHSTSMRTRTTTLRTPA